jgi:hypothetical protein
MIKEINKTLHSTTRVGIESNKSYYLDVNKIDKRIQSITMVDYQKNKEIFRLETFDETLGNFLQLIKTYLIETDLINNL